MDFDLFFSSPRWKILEILAKKPSSPLEISKDLKTSVAYVSQQLRLLEAAGFIFKERTGMAEKGKPRNVFSITNEVSYISILTKSFAKKKLLYLTPGHKIILNIWLLDNPKIHPIIEKFYYKIEEDLRDIASIWFDSDKQKIIIFSDSKKVKQKTEIYFRENNSLDFSVYSSSEIKKFFSEKFENIYSNALTFKENNVLKGGDF